MNLILSWLLAILIIIIVCGVISMFFVLVYWVWEIRRVIKNVPKDINKEIQEDKVIQKEVEDAREKSRRERQRRAGASETSGHTGEQKQSVQYGSPSKIPETRESSKSSAGTSREVEEGSKPVVNRHGRIAQI